MQNTSFLKSTANVIGNATNATLYIHKLFTSRTRNILYKANLHVDWSALKLARERERERERARDDGETASNP